MPWRVRLPIVVFWAVLAVWSPAPSQAIGRLDARNATDAALGLSNVSDRVLVDGVLGTSAAGWMIEAGQRALFGVAGLHTSHFRGVFRGRYFGILISGVTLSSPIGGERAIRVEPMMWSRKRFGGSFAVTLHSTAFDTHDGAHLATAAAEVVLRLSPSLAVTSAMAGHRLAGEPLPGADTDVRIVARFARSATLAGGIHIARNGLVEAAVGAVVEVHRVLDAALGYADGTGVLRGSVTLRVSRLRVEFGAAMHPILGVSKSVFIIWRG